MLVSTQELLLDRDRRGEAKQLVENIITGHNTGTTLEVEARKRLHLILWEQAARDFENSEFSDSLQWYNYSFSLFPPSDERDKNVAKLQVSELDKSVGFCPRQQSHYSLQKPVDHDISTAFGCRLECHLHLVNYIRLPT